MRLYCLPGNDPFHNLAWEEAILEQGQPCLLLWRNCPSVIIGRHQNSWTEVNLVQAWQHNIPVIRRITGGGAVYHDLGNLNFSLIEPLGETFEREHLIDALCSYLLTWHINAVRQGSNDLVAEGRKISGFASTETEKALLFHGTLLFRADLDRMDGLLRPDESKLLAKGIHSVRSRVGNLSDLGNINLTPDQFADAIAQALEQTFKCERLPAPVLKRTGELERLRYRSNGWNIGRDPKSVLTDEKSFPRGNIQLTLEVQGGKVTECLIQGNFPDSFEVDGFCEAMRQISFLPQEVLHLIKNYCMAEKLGCSAEELMVMFFGANRGMPERKD